MGLQHLTNEAHEFLSPLCDTLTEQRVGDVFEAAKELGPMRHGDDDDAEYLSEL